MDTLVCPYCGQEKLGSYASDFSHCRFCGFRSALVDSNNNGRLLIVDRRMPFLKRRCDDLAAQLNGVSIVVDRRVVQDSYDHPDRRVNKYSETKKIARRPDQADKVRSPRDVSSL